MKKLKVFERKLYKSRKLVISMIESIGIKGLTIILTIILLLKIIFDLKSKVIRFGPGKDINKKEEFIKYWITITLEFMLFTIMLTYILTENTIFALIFGL